MYNTSLYYSNVCIVEKGWINKFIFNHLKLYMAIRRSSEFIFSKVFYKFGGGNQNVKAIIKRKVLWDFMRRNSIFFKSLWSSLCQEVVECITQLIHLFFFFWWDLEKIMQDVDFNLWHHNGSMGYPNSSYSCEWLMDTMLWCFCFQIIF